MKSKAKGNKAERMFCWPSGLWHGNRQGRPGVWFEHYVSWRGGVLSQAHCLEQWQGCISHSQNDVENVCHLSARLEFICSYRAMGAGRHCPCRRTDNGVKLTTSPVKGWVKINSRLSQEEAGSRLEREGRRNKKGSRREQEKEKVTETSLLSLACHPKSKIRLK